jgi:uncharacterized membrane-anchored protein
MGSCSESAANEKLGENTRFEPNGWFAHHWVGSVFISRMKEFAVVPSKSKLMVKVPAVTLVFWIIKILATTLGETGGDALSMSMNLGYLVSTGIFAFLFVVVVFFQIKAERFYPALYWLTIVATTTVGTTLADFVDRSLGIGYAGGSAILVVLLLLSFFIWYRSVGSVSLGDVTSIKSESFYWLTIMFSQTLGTALGDWTADTEALGYAWSAVIFGSLLAVIAILYFSTKISRTWLFWSAFVMTRPLGAVLGDFLDKPLAKGGLNLDRYSATLTLFLLMGILIFIFSRRPAKQTH